jgi:transposase
VLVAKRIEQGVFCWPRIEDGVMQLSAPQLAALLDGLDWMRVYGTRRTRVPIAAN